MRLTELRFGHIIHIGAGLVLLGTLALFGYEAAKPPIVVELQREAGPKYSALAPVAARPTQLHRLPTLPERYQRKVLVYGWRRKNSILPVQPGKTYMAWNLPAGAENE